MMHYLTHQKLMDDAEEFERLFYRLMSKHVGDNLDIVEVEMWVKAAHILPSLIKDVKS